MTLSSQITVVTANFKTPDLVQSCLVTFHEFYTLPYTLIDNGGCAESVKVCRALAEKYPNVHLVLNHSNIFHGPALDQGIALAKTPYVFTLDSDTQTLKGGFLEEMLDAFAKDPKLFAIGWLRYVGNNGVASPHQHLKRGHPYVHPYASLIDVAKYHTLRPYNRSGAPAYETMFDAIQQGYHLTHFELKDTIEHKIAGTRGRFAGQYNPRTDAQPGKWRMHRI